jgi:hypothetical protein
VPLGNVTICLESILLHKSKPIFEPPGPHLLWLQLSRHRMPSMLRLRGFRTNCSRPGCLLCSCRASGSGALAATWVEPWPLRS